MPSLAVAIVAKKDALAIGKPHKTGIPPDLQSALELLFFLEERRTGKVPPTPAWFLAEAFGAQQCRNFKATEPLQHFLQGLLGSAYSGPLALGTYYSTVVFALTLKEVYSGICGTGSTDIVHDLVWCLQYWGIRNKEVRKEMVSRTIAWIQCTVSKSGGSPQNTVNPNIIYERGYELLGIMQKRGVKLVKEVNSILIDK